MLNIFILIGIIVCIIFYITFVGEVNNSHMSNSAEELTNNAALRTVREVLMEKSSATVRLYLKGKGDNLLFLWQGLSSHLTGKYSSGTYPYINYGSYYVISELPESNGTNARLVVRAPEEEI